MKVLSSAAAALDLFDNLRKRYSVGRKPDERPEMDAYLRGIQDASTCSSNNASLYCRDAGPACLQNYHNGYRVGETAKEAKLREAYRLGQEARESNNRFIPLNHPKASGPCFYVWREVFNSGLGGQPFTLVGR